MMGRSQKGQSCCVKPSGFLAWGSISSATVRWAGRQRRTRECWTFFEQDKLTQLSGYDWYMEVTEMSRYPFLPCLNLFIAPISRISPGYAIHLSLASRRWGHNQPFSMAKTTADYGLQATAHPSAQVSIWIPLLKRQISSPSIETWSKLTSFETSTFAKFGQYDSKVIRINVRFPQETDEK